MNELYPELKRLLKWAREIGPSEQAEAPFGFSGRIAALRKPARFPTLLQELQRSAWALTLASVVLIVCGALIWLNQSSAPVPTAEFSSALSFLASDLDR